MENTMNKTRRYLILGLLLVSFPAAMVFAAGQAEGPDTEIQMPRQPRQYISPQGDPGAVNELVLPFSDVVAPRPGNVVVEYHLAIFDMDGHLVWQKSDIESARRGFFGNLFGGEKPRVPIPDTLVWDGTFQGSDRGQDGEYVPDGDYTYQLIIVDDGGYTASTPPFAVTVDNEPPVVSRLEAPYTVFAPVEGSARDTLAIRQEGSREHEWRGVIRDADGTVVWEKLWRNPEPRNRMLDESPPSQIEWDGRYLREGDDTSGERVPEGRYTYELVGLDRAGNRTVRTMEQEIELSLTFGDIELHLGDQEPAFSPADTGTQDLLRLYTRVLEPEGIRSWTVTVAPRQAPQNAVRTITGNPPVEEEIVFDGRNNTGQVLRDGEYQAVLSVEYLNGIRTDSFPVVFEIDTVPPAVRLSAETSPVETISRDPIVFGGESRRAVVFSVVTRETLDWIAHVDLDGEAFGEFLLSDLVDGEFPLEVSWDGSDPGGRPMPDGTYTVYLEATDRAGNTGRSPVLEIRKDTRDASLSAMIAEDDEGTDTNDTADNDETEDQVPEEPDAGAAEDSAAEDSAADNSSGEPDRSNQDALDEYRISPRPGAQRTALPVLVDVSPEDGVHRTVLEVRDAEDRVVFTEHVSGAAGSFTWYARNNAGAPVADGAYTVFIRAEFFNGDRPEVALTETIVVDSSMPTTDEPELVLTGDPIPFTPDPDDPDDPEKLLRLKTEVWTAHPVESWKIEILDPRGRSFAVFEGTGEPDETVVWDGRDPSGELVQSAEEYLAVFTVTDLRGNTGETVLEIPVGIIVIRDGDLLRIRIPSIMFGPNTADLFAVSREELDKNLDTLRRLAHILNAYDGTQIVIEGHAAHVYWQAGERNRLEQQQTLIPLSARRAEQVRRALVILGVDRDRLSTEGVGGARPVVPHSDRENVWKNRRVEFILAP
jgi:outer membrane protein OmpA-like peptidoglycan-associated protein